MKYLLILSLFLLGCDDSRLKEQMIISLRQKNLQLSELNKDLAAYSALSKNPVCLHDKENNEYYLIKLDSITKQLKVYTSNSILIDDKKIYGWHDYSEYYKIDDVVKNTKLINCKDVPK